MLRRLPPDFLAALVLLAALALLVVARIGGHRGM